MKLVDPVAGIGDEELPDRTGIGTIEVDRISPFVVVPIGEIGGRKRSQVVAHRSQVVVHDVEDHSDAERVRAIHEAAQIVGPAVQPRRREHVDAVVTPAEPAGEVGDRHHFDDGNAGMRQLRQLALRGRPRPFACEGADVQLVDHLARQRHAAPAHVGPFEGARIDDLRRAIRARGLKPRSGIGVRMLAVIELELITGARTGGHDAAEITAIFGGEHRLATANDRGHALRRRSPHAHVGAAIA